MAVITDTSVPRFFNTPNGILTTIGLNNVLLGFMVTGIIGEVSILVLVPIVNSTAGCLASALGYYIGATYYATSNKVVAFVFQNIAFLVSAFGMRFTGLPCLGIHCSGLGLLPKARALGKRLCLYIIICPLIYSVAFYHKCDIAS